MTDYANVGSYWGGGKMLMDFFKPLIAKSEYNSNSINTLYNQYDAISHHSAELIKKLLGQLTDFDELMRLGNARFADNQKNQQSANQLFDAVMEVIGNIEKIRNNYAEKSEEYTTLTSAIEYSNGLINNHVSQLEQHEPKSVALRWYKEHLNTTKNSLSA